MATIKSILKRLTVEVSKGTRTCKNSGESITKGNKCLIVHDGMYEKYPYCEKIALLMIEQARERLDELEEQLSG